MGKACTRYRDAIKGINQRIKYLSNYCKYILTHMSGYSCFNIRPMILPKIEQPTEPSPRHMYYCINFQKKLLHASLNNQKYITGILHLKQ